MLFQAGREGPFANFKSKGDFKWETELRESKKNLKSVDYCKGRHVNKHMHNRYCNAELKILCNYY